jgi:hypothetical protein
MLLMVLHCIELSFQLIVKIESFAQGGQAGVALKLDLAVRLYAESYMWMDIAETLYQARW